MELIHSARIRALYDWPDMQPSARIDPSIKQFSFVKHIFREIPDKYETAHMQHSVITPFSLQFRTELLHPGVATLEV